VDGGGIGEDNGVQLTEVIHHGPAIISDRERSVLGIKGDDRPNVAVVE